MNKAKKISANLPEDLLRDASRVTKKGITETIIEGLKLVKRSGAFEKAKSLKGQLNLEIDLKESRERSGR